MDNEVAIDGISFGDCTSKKWVDKAIYFGDYALYLELHG